MAADRVMPLMKCGHTAQAFQKMPDGSERPACAICVGIDPGSTVVDEAAPSLEGRRARCSYNHDGRGCPTTRHGGGCCTSDRASDYGLAFFELQLDEEFDRFYCGCWGWD